MAILLQGADGDNHIIEPESCLNESVMCFFKGSRHARKGGYRLAA